MLQLTFQVYVLTLPQGEMRPVLQVADLQKVVARATTRLGQNLIHTRIHA
jgi:hypothetical protein